MCKSFESWDNMSKFLNDPDLKQMAIDESEGEMPIDENINMQDIKSMLDDLIKTRWNLI